MDDNYSGYRGTYYSVFMSDVAKMLSFAMICSFVSTPIFAALNLSLVLKGEHKVKGGLFWLSIAGLIYLSAFTLLLSLMS
ncbi:manganese transporter NRAMP [Actinobacillus equuli]|nr:manganese transporter NRAMP [Actinobacillus equuli]